MAGSSVLPRFVGVEHELAVLAEGAVIDAAQLADRFLERGRRLRPDRPSTVRLASGAELSWEEGDAEVATPPLPIEPGVIEELVAWSGTAERELVAALADGCTVEGRSTHISVSVPDEHALDVAALFARRFGPTLLALTEAPGGEGLLIRPRHQRVELGIEYARGDVLRAAAAFAAGGLFACLDARTGDAPASSLPPSVDVRVEGATRRFGWYVALRSLPHGLEDHHRVAWAAARRALAPLVSADDLRFGDDALSGRLALPSHVGVNRAPEESPPVLRTHPLGIASTGVVGPAIKARAVTSTWAETTFEVTDWWARPPRPAAKPGRPRRPMARALAWTGVALLALGTGVVIGSLLPARPDDPVAAAPPSAEAAAAPVTTPRTSAPTCVAVASVAFAETQPTDGGWVVYFPVEVHDGDQALLEGAQVSITNQKSDGTSTSARGVTGANGMIVFGVRTTAPGANRIEIVDVASTGCAWDRAASVASATGAAP